MRSRVRRPGAPRETAIISIEADGDIRCGCHRLMARWLPEGLELRCARCKTTSLVPLGTLEDVPLAAE